MMASARKGQEAARRRALDILRKNDRGDYSVPQLGLYPVQFNWDSAFASLGYRLLSVDRAWRELEMLVSAQHADGMIPHIIFRENCEGYFPGMEIWQAGGANGAPQTSGISNPPIATLAARRLFALHGAPDPPARLGKLVLRLARWHDWFARCRRDTTSGAALITHPWESGRDNSPDWDAALARVSPDSALGAYHRADLDHVASDQRPKRADYDRYLTLVRFGVAHGWAQKTIAEQSPFRMLDPLMTAVLAKAERDLAELAVACGHSDLAAAAAARADGWADGLRALWCDKTGAYTAHDPRNGGSTQTLGCAAFLAPLAGVTDEKPLHTTLQHFDRIVAQTPYALPSFDPSCHSFNARRYWRGPVWLIINRLVGWGLASIGEHARAEKLRASSAALVASGFWEYYDPSSGEGLGGKDFTWTAATFLDWSEQ